MSAAIDRDVARGFRNDGASCAALHLPRNAHIDHSGNDWECDAQYRRAEAGCVPERSR